uniref:Type I restriction-modification system, specificity subunit S n=1 Tax=Rheinheimera sp. BAL341 TaxID=1708203 RepID=A0A486XGQ1_9GAMM
MAFSLHEAKPIAELCRIIDCEHKTAPYVDSSEYLVVRTSNVRDGRLVMEDMKFTTHEGYQEWTQRAVPEFGDVLFTREAPAGESCLVPQDMKVCMGQRMVLLRPNKLKVDPIYLSMVLATERGKADILRLSIGSTVSRINISDIRNIKIAALPLVEQKKIAQILSTWDQAISTTEQLLANSQQQKKALMQQLLTGRKRLLDKSGVRFSGEWKDIPLNKMAEVIVSPVDKKTEPNEIPVELCNYTDVYYNHQITRNITFMKATATKSEVAKYTLRQGDVIITKDSETPGDIAIPALVSEDLKGVVCGYHLAIVRPHIDCLHGAFLNYLFSMQSTRYYFFTLATGATRFGLSVGGINRAHFRVPDVAEQQKIAAVLSTTDREITLLQKKLEALKQEKKALMQQLLTGKRRVKINEKEVA